MVKSKPQRCVVRERAQLVFFSPFQASLPAPVHPAWLMIDLIALRVSHHKTEEQEDGNKNQRTTSSSAADASKLLLAVLYFMARTGGLSS